MCDFGILNGFLKFTFWRVRIFFCFTNPLPTLVQVSILKQLPFLNGLQFCTWWKSEKPWISCMIWNSLRIQDYFWQTAFSGPVYVWGPSFFNLSGLRRGEKISQHIFSRFLLDQRIKDFIKSIYCLKLNFTHRALRKIFESPIFLPHSV